MTPVAKTRLRDLGVCLSFSNLCFVRVWSELLTYGPAVGFRMKAPPQPAHYIAAALNTVLLGSVLWGVLSLARREKSGRLMKYGRWAFLVLLLIPLNALRLTLADAVPNLRMQDWLRFAGPGVLAAFSVTTAVSAAIAAVKMHRPATRLAAAVLLAFLPCVPLTLFGALYRTRVAPHKVYADKHVAAVLPVRPAPHRVVVVVFDEWDQAIALERRPAGLKLPELDRFKAGSLRASNAYAAGGNTLISLPSMVTGKTVVRAAAAGPDELVMTFAGETAPVLLGAQPTVFSQARESGFRTAMVGWYIPYCRVLGRDLDTCWWDEMGWRHNVYGTRLPEIQVSQARSLVETVSHSLLGQSLYTRKHIGTYLSFLEAAKQASADPTLGLVFIHAPVPHAPFFYDGARRDFTRCCYSAGDYYDALRLADRTLGELRERMEAAGVWEKSAVLLTSDHNLRTADLLGRRIDRRVPFLLKLAGQSGSLEYRQDLSNVVIHDLAIQILRGALPDYQAVAAWLDRNRSRFTLHL